ncbi:MAG: class I SAM-dependent methyltransferase [Sphingobacteriales bacterium]|nr:MAG: class I SAM-dependent methyltransferase [Sphingobacteriales bacterium]
MSKLKERLGKWLQLPEMEQFDLDDPGLTEQRKQIILGKPFLKKIYIDWYNEIKNRLAGVPKGKIVEIGSGAGFFKQIMPEVITSDIMPLSSTDITFSAEEMPFADAELSGITMVDVLHHIPHAKLFFKEAVRTLKPGGKIVMVEPSNSAWGRFIFSNFHHEPWNPLGDWELPSSGPLSGANGALPWIIFVRDRKLFEQEFPELKITYMRQHTPLRYLLSGGVSLKAMVPAWSSGFFILLEKLTSPISNAFAMFQTIEITRK